MATSAQELLAMLQQRREALLGQRPAIPPGAEPGLATRPASIVLGPDGSLAVQPPDDPEDPSRGSSRARLFGQRLARLADRHGAPFPFVGTAAAGLAEGLLSDPFIQLAVKIGTFGAVDREDLDDVAKGLSDVIDGRPLASTFKFIGDFGPDLLIGGALFSLGRKLAAEALLVNAPKIQAALQGSKAKLFAEQIERMKLLRTVNPANAREVGEVVRPAVQIAAETVGGSVGGATFGALDALARGGGPEAVVQGALLGGVFTGAADVAITGIGSLRLGELAKRKFVTPVGKKVYDELSPILKERSKEAIESTKNAMRAQNRANAEKVKKALERSQEARKNLERAIGAGAEKETIKELRAAARESSAELEDALRIARSGSAKAVAFRDFLKIDPVASKYLFTEPLSPDDKAQAIWSMMTWAVATPEGLLPRMGVTGARFLTSVAEAERERTVMRAANRRFLDRFKKRTARAMGLKSIPKDGKYLEKVVDVYEKDGITGVAAQFGDEMASAFRELDLELRDLYQPLVRIGAAPLMTRDDLAELGLSAFWPHVLRKVDDKALREAFIAQEIARGVPEHVAAGNADRTLLTFGELIEGITRHGSQQFRRQSPGSLRERIAAQAQAARKNPQLAKQLGGRIFIEDPVEALESYLDAIATARSFGRRFGFRSQDLRDFKDAVVLAAEAEGADRALMRTITDELLDYKFYNEATKRLVQNVASLEVLTKLTSAVLANMTQPSNTAVMAGLGNTVRGVMDVVKDPALRHRISEALGLYESVFQSVRRSYSNLSTTDNLLDKLADGTLRWTGFSTVEKFNRLISGAAGIHLLKDTIAKGITGNLRGKSYLLAKRRLGFVGVDIDDAIPKARAAMQRGASLDEAITDALGGPDAVDRLIYNMAKVTQFLPDITRRPLLWSHPIGRIMTQFKQFTLNQGRLMRDFVARDFAEAGNAEPVALLLGLYPMLGDLVREERRILLGGRSRESKSDFDRYLEDFTALGAFGLVGNAATSAKFGDLKGLVLGPVSNDAELLGLGLIRLVNEGETEVLQRLVKKQPLYRAATGLMTLGDRMSLDDIFTYTRLVGDSDSPLPPQVNIRDITIQKVLEKLTVP